MATHESKTLLAPKEMVLPSHSSRTHNVICVSAKIIRSAASAPPAVASSSYQYYDDRRSQENNKILINFIQKSPAAAAYHQLPIAHVTGIA